MSQNRYKVCVTGVLAFVLYISRALCVAPLVFEARGVRVSRFLSIIGRVLITLTGSFVLINGYFMIFHLHSEKTILSRTFWTFNLLGILTTNAIAVYTAPSRMHLYLKSLQTLNQINEDMNDAVVEKSRKKIEMGLAYFVVTSLITHTVSYCGYMLRGLKEYDGINAFRHINEMIVHLIERLLISVFTVQLTLLTLRVLFTLKNINAQFTRVIQRHSSNRSVLEVSDIRRFAFPYMSVSRIVSQVVEHDENVTIVILITFFTHLVFSIHTLFSEIYHFNVETIIMTFIDLIIAEVSHLFYLVLLIEPCHRVHAEMEQTHQLVNKAMVFSNLSVQVTNELDAFNLLLKLNKPTYSPLRLCTLARPLFLKMVGALISYGVLILQLSEDIF